MSIAAAPPPKNERGDEHERARGWVVFGTRAKTDFGGQRTEREPAKVHYFKLWIPRPVRNPGSPAARGKLPWDFSWELGSRGISHVTPDIPRDPNSHGKSWFPREVPRELPTRGGDFPWDLPWEAGSSHGSWDIGSGNFPTYPTQPNSTLTLTLTQTPSRGQPPRPRLRRCVKAPPVGSPLGFSHLPWEVVPWELFPWEIPVGLPVGILNDVVVRKLRFLASILCDLLRRISCT